jgi:cell division protein FtsZ
MVFIVAGMGGDTGTGAAPVIAHMAKERGSLTVGVVTKPFEFEGVDRERVADGITELQQYVDTLIVIPNEHLLKGMPEPTNRDDAFKAAAHAIYSGVRSVTDLLLKRNFIGMDFADVRTVTADMGKAAIGSGQASGKNRAIRAAELAIADPLLDDTHFTTVGGLLITVTGGADSTLVEVDQAVSRIRKELNDAATVIFGWLIDEGMTGTLSISIVAVARRN